MNPLCCIAPVSIDRDRANPGPCQLGLEDSVKNISFGSKQGLSAQVSSINADSDAVSRDVEDAFTEARDGKLFGASGGVAGILYKWVNYGKGWRSRWFVLEDGVLSYYKIHGPDKIFMSPAREKSLKVIGEDSLRFMRKNSWSHHHRLGASAKQWKPFGEIHLKVCLCFCFIFQVILSIHVPSKSTD